MIIIWIETFCSIHNIHIWALNLIVFLFICLYLELYTIHILYINGALAGEILLKIKLFGNNWKVGNHQTYFLSKQIVCLLSCYVII